MAKRKWFQFESGLDHFHLSLHCPGVTLLSLTSTHLSRKRNLKRSIYIVSLQEQNRKYMLSGISLYFERKGEINGFIFFPGTRKGIPAMSGGVGFYRTRLAGSDWLYPDIQVQMSSSLIGGVFKKIWNFNKEVPDSLSTTHALLVVLVS